MKNGELNINERSRKFAPIIQNYNTIITSIFMVSADHMATSLLVCSHPLEDSIPTTVSVTLAMTGQKSQRLVQHRLLREIYSITSRL